MPAKKVSGGSYQFSSTCANPNTPGMVFSPVHCAEHFFTGPWPCSCPLGPQEAALLSSADEISMGGARGGMKLSPLGSLVLTPTGFVEMGALKIGQMVSDPTTGGPTEVIGIYPHPPMDIWKFTFDDGASLEVGADHLWAYREANHRRPRSKHSDQRDFGASVLGSSRPDTRWDRYRVGTAAQIIKEFNEGRGLRFPLTEPVLFRPPKTTHKLPAYMLGLFLGDGYLKNANITSADPEIQEYLESWGFSRYEYPGKCPSFSATGAVRHKALKWFERYGIIDCVSDDKFVPSHLKYSSLSDRVDLLRGLLDTDGTVDIRGRVYFCSTSYHLASDVRWIVRSVGGKARIKVTDDPSFVLPNGERRFGKTAYTVRIWHPRLKSLFNLSRKKDRCTNSWNGGYEITRELKSIEYVGKKEARCIRVTSPYGLYLGNDFVVTHNSETLLIFMIKGNIGLKKFPPSAQLTGPDVTYSAHRNYRGLILIEQANDLGYLLDRAEPIYSSIGGRVTRGNPAECEFPSGAKIIFGYFGEDGWKKYIGPEFQRVAFDQMEKMARRETHDRIIGSVRSRWPELVTQVFSTWNPGGGDDLKGAPGQAWIMDYFRVEDYINRKLLYRQPFNTTDGSKRLLFIPSKVTDNPYLRWKFEKLSDGVLKQVLAWKCKTCGKTTQSISRPEECSNRACPTNQIVA